MDYHRYAYNIRTVELTLDKNYQIPDDSVVYLNIRHDYMKRTMPIIQMAIQLDSDTIAKVYKFKDTAKLNLEVVENELDSTSKEILTSRMYVKHSFSIIPMRDETSYLTSNNSDTANYVDEVHKQQAFEFYLVDMTFVNYFAKEISTIIKSSSKPAALQCLFKMRDIPARMVIATPPEDITIRDYILVPLGNLTTNISEMNRTYGLYSANPIVYYDLKNLYCINRIKPNVTIASATDFDTVTFTLKNSVSAEAKIPGGCIDTASKSHYINLQGAPAIQDNSTQVSSTQFSTIQTVDANGNVSKVTLDSNNTKLNFIYQHNDMTVNQEINEKYVPNYNVVLSLADSPASYFKPTKQYNFVTESEYSNLTLDNRVFRISTLSLNIQRNGFEFNHTLNVELYRI